MHGLNDASRVHKLDQEIGWAREFIRTMESQLIKLRETHTETEALSCLMVQIAESSITAHELLDSVERTDPRDEYERTMCAFKDIGLTMAILVADRAPR